MSLVSRIEEIRKSKNLSMRAFERECGIPNGTISLAIKSYNEFIEGRRTSEPSFNVASVEKILHKFNISANWLILGIGEKLLSDINVVAEPSATYGLKTMLEKTTMQLNEQKKQNADLERLSTILRMRCIENNLDISDIEF